MYIYLLIHYWFSKMYIKWKTAHKFSLAEIRDIEKSIHNFELFSILTSSNYSSISFIASHAILKQAQHLSSKIPEFGKGIKLE